MRWVILFTLAASVWTAASENAEAQRRGTGRMADSWQQRPLTLPKATLRFDIHEDDHDESWGGLLFRSFPCRMDERCNDVFFNFGFSAGIIDDFEIGALVAPVRFTRGARYQNPQLYVRYRFLRGGFQMGVEGRVEFPVADGREGWGQVGLPMRVRAGNLLRLDFGPHLRTEFNNYANLMFPFRMGFQISQPFFLGLDSGVFFNDFPDNDNDDVNVPLGMFFGFTFFNRDPVVDLMWGFRVLDVTDDGQREVFEGWFSARFYLYL